MAGGKSKNDVSNRFQKKKPLGKTGSRAFSKNGKKELKGFVDQPKPYSSCVGSLSHVDASTGTYYSLNNGQSAAKTARPVSESAYLNRRSSDESDGPSTSKLSSSSALTERKKGSKCRKESYKKLFESLAAPNTDMSERCQRAKRREEIKMESTIDSSADTTNDIQLASSSVVLTELSKESKRQEENNEKLVSLDTTAPSNTALAAVNSVLSERDQRAKRREEIKKEPTDDSNVDITKNIQLTASGFVLAVSNRGVETQNETNEKSVSCNGASTSTSDVSMAALNTIMTARERRAKRRIEIKEEPLVESNSPTTTDIEINVVDVSSTIEKEAPISTKIESGAAKIKRERGQKKNSRGFSMMNSFMSEPSSLLN